MTTENCEFEALKCFDFLKKHSARRKKLDQFNEEIGIDCSVFFMNLCLDSRVLFDLIP